MNATQACTGEHLGGMRPIRHVSRGVRFARGQASAIAAVPSIIAALRPRRCRHGHDPVVADQGPVCRRCYRRAVPAGTGIRWVT